MLLPLDWLEKSTGMTFFRNDRHQIESSDCFQRSGCVSSIHYVGS